MTTGKTVSAINARCAGWRPIEYSVTGKNEPEKHGDTVTTINQIRVHNQTGINKRCPKFLGK